MRRLALFLCFAAAPASAASADKDQPFGRYALDAASCKAKDYFVTVTETTLTLPTFGCKGVDYDQTESKDGRMVYKAIAKSCVGEESAKPGKQTFTLVVDNGTLQILWSDGSKSAVFTRCGAP